MAGLFCIVICALGVFLAPTFILAQIFYALNGVGSVIVGVMTSTLIGELYSLEKKAIRISWVFVTAQFAILVGSPITGYIADTEETVNWHSALLWFTIPVSAASMVIVAQPCRLAYKYSAQPQNKSNITQERLHVTRILCLMLRRIKFIRIIHAITPTSRWSLHGPM